ncbi:unnamed protein product [Eruca vesicaria subsp. sativa]|uniref:Uncharacterized protein n=1 Tax=Eruca vesicaria subsp. sativa TaxID=29727 RepID=A0ABC8M4A6_ERUVS|nr:unnamed protein product [Eruca vesicaria subsp. sativa]
MDDLIPPSDALQIDALNDVEQGNEEGLLPDTEMQETTTGKELMLMEEYNLLGEEHEDQEQADQLHGVNQEAEKKNEKDYAVEDSAQKALTRSVARSLFTSSQVSQERRASPRLNENHSSNVVGTTRGRGGRKRTTTCL